MPTTNFLHLDMKREKYNYFLRKTDHSLFPGNFRQLNAAKYYRI